MTKVMALAALLLVWTPMLSQQGTWQASLQRADGESIVFSFEWKVEHGKDIWYIKNAGERLRVDDIRRRNDSIFISMPLFESQFSLHFSNQLLTGVWMKEASASRIVMPFSARMRAERFESTTTRPAAIDGRWSLQFDQDTTGSSVGEFTQSGKNVTGTVLTPTGDYRYLEGVVTNDSLFLSTFDGSHAYLFKARVRGNDMQGLFFSGTAAAQRWKADKNESAAVSQQSVAMFLKPGEDSLHFAFKDLDGNLVSITDERFRNKVVVVQLMGSWCPNCMDETAFLSDYYTRNRNRGIEVVSLAYEYSTDYARSVNSLRKFQRRFKVEYPMLVTGVTVLDSLRTEKTLPELTPIKFFPSSVIIDKKGIVRKTDTGFNGPATGEHYIAYKKNFEATVNGLLNE